MLLHWGGSGSGVPEFVVLGESGRCHVGTRSLTNEAAFPLQSPNLALVADTHMALQGPPSPPGMFSASLPTPACHPPSQLPSPAASAWRNLLLPMLLHGVFFLPASPGLVPRALPAPAARCLHPHPSK